MLRKDVMTCEEKLKELQDDYETLESGFNRLFTSYKGKVKELQQVNLDFEELCQDLEDKKIC